MTFKVGDRVLLKVSQSYLKTNDPMPMLRPADLVSLEEVGSIVGFLPMNIVEVRFRRGTFLLPDSHLKAEIEPILPFEK